MYLYSLIPGEKGRVLSIQDHADIGNRLRELGIIDGTVVTCLGKSPLGDPTAYAVRGAVIAIRKADAAKIIIEREG